MSAARPTDAAALLARAPGLLAGLDPRQWSRGDWTRLGLSLAIDLFDFSVGRSLFWLPWEEGGYGLAAVALWGWRGVFALAELADITEQVDGFLPVVTLIGLLRLRARALKRHADARAQASSPSMSSDAGMR